jgi:hypothetical protein
LASFQPGREHHTLASYRSIPGEKETAGEMILLKISYKLRAHHVADYERAFAERTLPLIREYGFRFWGIWRTVIGDAQEYLELWEFESLTEFDKRWHDLMADPRLIEIFETTGPMVEDEKLSIFEPALRDPEFISILARGGGAPSSHPASA